MVEVNLWSGLRRFTGGQDKIEVEARTVGDVLKGIVQVHPGLDSVVEAGVSVAVDGKVIASDLTAPVNPDSEVFLIPQLKGG